MKDGTLIVFTGDKGGVGKSTLAVLLTEWFLSQGKQVRLIGLDHGVGHPNSLWARPKHLSTGGQGRARTPMSC